GDGKLYAKNANGTRKWEFATSAGFGNLMASASIAPNGIIFIGAIDHNLYSINSSDGTQHAPPFQTGGEIDSSPAIAADGTVYIGASDGRLYAVLNQVQQWVFPPLNQNPVGQIHSSPAIGPDGAIYFGSDDGNLYAINGSSPLASSPWPMFQKD